MLIQHIRHCEKLIGTVVAIDKDSIGWSQCSPRDKFNKKRGIEIAEGRAIKGTDARPVKIRYYDVDIHHIICNDIISDYIERMRDRAEKYFKEDYDAPG